MSIYFYTFLARYFLTFIRQRLCGFNFKVIKSLERFNYYFKVVVQIIIVCPFSEKCARAGLLTLYHARESLRSKHRL